MQKLHKVSFMSTRFTRLEWRNSSALKRALTFSPLNTSGINWKGYLETSFIDNKLKINFVIKLY